MRSAAALRRPPPARQRAPHADGSFRAPLGLLHAPVRDAERIPKPLDVALGLGDLGPRLLFVGSGPAQAQRVDFLLVEGHRACLPPGGTATGAPAPAD